jgi:hypothetical protein
MKTALLLLAALALPAKAEGLNLDRWTREDSYRQSAVTALLVADWAQTRYATKHPQDRYKEVANPILGSRPTIGKTNNYFSLSIIGHAAISYMLPPAWRHGWQYIWIGVEANAVYYNHNIGVKMDF